MTWSRREALVGLLAAGCVHRAAPPLTVVDGVDVSALPVRLGWRWVPGVRVSYRTTVRREIGPVVWTRAEAWTYTVRSLDSRGIATIEGRLTAFGATVEADGHALDDSRLDDRVARERDRAISTVSLGMRLTGPLVTCSARGFGDALPHRLLALHFPADAVASGATWVDDGLPRAFAPVLPLDVEVHASGMTTLTGLDARDGVVRATLQHRARVGIGDFGPGIELDGTTTWDTTPGLVRSRTLHARWTPDAPAHGLPVGSLHAELTRTSDP